jgi:hypothetical protein
VKTTANSTALNKNLNIKNHNNLVATKNSHLDIT